MKTNKLDDIDILLYEYFNNHKKEEVPKEFSNNIRKIVSNLKYNKTSKIDKIKRIILSIISASMLLGGIAFATYTITRKNITLSSNKGMDRAIKNGYIYNDIGEEIESSNIKINVDAIVMDDSNLNFKIELDISKIDKKIPNVTNILYPDLIVYDENKNILYCGDKNTFENFCKDNNLNLKFGRPSDNYISSGITMFADRERDDKKDKLTSIIQLYSANNFPKSKKLFFEFKNIKFKYEEKVLYTTTGEWKFKLDLPEKFYNREAISYNVTNCSMPELNITECIVYNTKTTFEFITWEEPWYDENASEEEKKRAIRNHENVIDIMVEEATISGDSSKLKLINDIYIQNQKGEKFYPEESSSEDSGFVEEPTGRVKYWKTFNLTKYNATDKIKIVFKYKGKDVEVELEK